MWSDSQCSLSIPFQYIRLAMLGYQGLLPGEFLSKNLRLMVTQHLQHLACGATAFTLWTRSAPACTFTCNVDTSVDSGS